MSQHLMVRGIVISVNELNESMVTKNVFPCVMFCLIKGNLWDVP